MEHAGLPRLKESAMRLAFGKQHDDRTTEHLQSELADAQARGEYLLSGMLALLACVKEFAHEMPEIGAQDFANEMEELQKHLRAAESLADLRRAFEGQPEHILHYVQRGNAYLEERESEFKSMISMLRQGLTVSFDDSQAFTRRVTDHNGRMEKIIYLNDLRRVREDLRNEVEAVRTTVAEKRASDMRKMEKLAEQVDTLRSNLERVTDISNTDALTGANNRLAFDLTLQRMMDRFTIAKTRCVLLMCDLDNFKSVNDNYGHPVGDRVLKSFVSECKAFFRDEDFVARYGGEEFAVLLPGATLADARARAQRFCRKLAGNKYRIYAENPEKTLSFTVSIGVAEARRGDTMASIVQRADQALYLAKKSGKNQALTEQDVQRQDKKRKTSLA